MEEMTMTVQENMNLINDLYNNFNSGNIESQINLFAEDAQLVDFSQPQPMNGREEIRNYIQGFSSAFPNGKIEIRNQIASGEFVAIEWVFRGTQTGPMEGPQGMIEPTGQVVELNGFDMFQIRNSKIQLNRSYYDSCLFLRQLGLMP